MLSPAASARLLAIRTGDLGWALAAFLQYTKQVSQPITQISQQVNTILCRRGRRGAGL